MQVYYGIKSYSTPICPFASGNCGEEGKNLKNLNILRTKRAL